MFTILSFSFGFAAFGLYAQWQPDVQLTIDPGISRTSFNNAWCIATSGDTVHIVWRDNRSGNYKIYYKRSTDAGISWGTEMLLTNTSAGSEYPSVAVSGSFVHVVWHDSRNGNFKIYYKRSTNAGISWGTDMQLTNNSTISYFSSVSVSGQAVHVVWYDKRDGNDEIYYKRSTDAGLSWGSDIRLTNDSAYSWYPSVTVSGEVVHVVWYDARDSPNFEIYYKRSTDGGGNWGTDTRLSNDPAISGPPCVGVSGQTVHVVWYDNRDGPNYEIYYKRSTDSGVNWGTDTRLTSNSAASYVPSIAVLGSGLHVVWIDERDGNFEIYYKKSTDGGISWGTDIRLTNDAAYSGGPSVALSGQVVHVIFYDHRDGNDEIYYKRDPTGNVVGVTNINAEIPNKFMLKQNYPNPFNPSTKIRFAIPPIETTRWVVLLKIYDALGREVTTLVNKQLSPGTYEIEWPARTGGNASNFPSGVYFYKLEVNDPSTILRQAQDESSERGFMETKRMVLIK